MPPELKPQKLDPVSDNSAIVGKKSRHHARTSQPQAYRRPSFMNRLYLSGVIYRPIDLAFILRALVSIVCTILHLLFIDIPSHIWTRCTVNSRHHPASWGVIYSFCMAMSRASSSSAYNVAQLRWVSNIIALFVYPRMFHLTNYRVYPNVEFKVHLNTLLKPERKSLQETRVRLGLRGAYQERNPSNPSVDYFKSFLPTDSGNNRRLANLPEESGILENDGTYVLKGEWIEALEDSTRSSDKRSGGAAKRSNVVLLYLHGGGHVFCSAKFHRQLVTRMTMEFGPGARAFVLDYRLAPEDPFPAAIHDAYAAYLYLTQPNHQAISLDCNNSGKVHHSTPINPKDIVLAGDSAGAGVAIALQLYLRDYVQPSVGFKIEMPAVTVLISAWTDISTSMPSAKSRHSYCYTPSPMGVNPFADQEAFYAFPKFNFARTYLCGDSQLVPNERNSGGKRLEWNWYRHLAQHPLVSPVYTADLSGLQTSTLLQAGTFDRLADDTRLYAHKLGQANPEQRVRLELYRDMVHVHQFFEFLPMADKAIQSLVAFVNTAQLHNNQDQRQQYQQQQPQQQRGSYSNKKGKAGRRETEWIVVDKDGTEREGHDDKGCPISVLERCWRQDQ
ncbi:hypothetical protein BGZ99_008349 [Dissophora globulifera]|uniref:Alpha/beta hydrolase fold-3 domain-containing protein n=1 Tax=Dissophora globulifera TaxID=979702 RepID=A0A9P6R9X0_9FUNG|nr:hypothetical protein BGZ99_008349 [Dissophora globulifera]